MKTLAIILLGILNILHGLSHGLQLIQSLLLASYSLSGIHDESNWYHSLMENPYMGIVWLLVGVSTVYLGIKDFKHHKHHKD